MKRDLKINYGILDDIIEELNKYKNALQTMENSLAEISTLVKINEGKSIDAWEEHIRTSKEEIKRYQEQVGDLHSLFNNYVSDTTAYISPLSRDTMMRVSRNNIWVNLQQINIGYTGNVTNALLTSHKPPNTYLFGLFDNPSDAEVEASNFNKRQMGNIQENIQHTQRKLENKMEVLWDLYNSKVKPFENTDDAYKDLASNVKKKYTGFFEGLEEKSNAFHQVQVDIIRGFVDGVIGMVTGVVTIAGDVGIVALSAIIPDPIEPELIKTKADETFEGYKETAIQLIQNPLSIIELAAQSVSDTVETEGMAYVTGGALTALIPASFGVKAVKGGAGLKGPGKTKVDKSPYSKEFTQGKIDAALAGLGNVKVPVFYKEKLSTGPSDITSVGVEMKSLSEVRPQLFAGKGEKRAGNVLDDGTVWGNIKITQPFYEGTKIPRSFELAVDGEKFWVHPNGTKHMLEYITRDATTHGMPINSQTLLSSFENSVKKAVNEGLKYEEIMNVGNWELIFSKPRGGGLLPVIKHAVYRP